MNSDVCAGTVLVVEDEDLLRWTISVKLEGAGMTVLAAGSCKRALDIGLRARVDLLISDYRLEDGFGDELVKKLNSGSNKPGLILMTGEIEKTGKDRFAGVSLVGLLSKPVDLDELTRLATGWLKSSTRRKISGFIDEYAGLFKLHHVSSLAELEELGADCGEESVALFLAEKGNFKSSAELAGKLRQLHQAGRRVCVICGDDYNIGVEACKLSGTERAADKKSLEILSRQFVSDPERAALMLISNPGET